MSEPKLISPMLDNFDMGDPVSEHNGVRCCPAMDKDANHKYIVKIISVPASPAQIDALLLSGAYSTKEEAVEYFKSVADEIAFEAEALKALSRIEGFDAFEQWQIEPMEDNSGYDVYLLSRYKKTLDKVLRADGMTHLQAVNLGLDLCSALSTCRRSGYLYIDLKPENVYLTEDQGYRIGDLGLIKLDSLKYASLPDRYRSRYTSPEIADAFSALNTTIDIYALGLILYQAFNGGALPVLDPSADTALPAPDYADYEMAEIILKACAPNPESRWQDPVEMGQAIVGYIQRNGAHDVPIVPVPVAEEAPTPNAVTDFADQSPAVLNNSESTDEGTDAQQETSADDNSEGNSAISYSEDDEGNLSFMVDDPNDETLPGHSEEALDYEKVSEEVTDMLNQADDLIAHPTPDPVIPPDPIDVPVPPPISLEPECEEEPIQPETDEDQQPDSEDAATESPSNETITEGLPEADASEEAESLEDEDDVIKPRSHWLRNAFLILAGLVLIAGGFIFYKFYYLREVSSLILQGSKNCLTVYVTSDAKDSDLTVVCSDTYGNKLSEPVVNGAAYFDNLAPSTSYTVVVEVDGFHKLIGKVETEYASPAMTTITQFTAVTGQEDGSVILTVTTDGPGTTDWKVNYSCEGEAEKEVVFSGAMTSITGLTIGKPYTFKLSPVADIYVTGENELTHTASKLILAENLLVTGCYNGVLTASWSSPKDVNIQTWTVRCYNNKGYNEVIVSDMLTATFEGVTDTDGYTLEVLASGMSVSQRVDVTENSITVSDFKVTESSNMLQLSWSSNNAPANSQWAVAYSIDNSPVQKNSEIDGTTCTLPLIPGAKYTISLQVASGCSVLGGQVIHNTKAPDNFNGYGITTEHMDFNMCVTPKNKNWDRYDVEKYTTEFTANEKAAFVVRLSKSNKTSSDKIEVLYVIRNKDGNIVSYVSNTHTWKSMWRNKYGQFEIPSIPDVAGNYSVTVFFNGALAGQESFTVK